MANTGGKLAIKKKGGAEMVFGAVFVLLPLVLLPYLPAYAMTFSVRDYFIRFLLMLLFIKGARMLLTGIRKHKLHQKLLRLQGLFDSSDRVPLSMAADLLGCSLTTLVGDVRAMQKLGIVQGLSIDLPRKNIVYQSSKEDFPTLSRIISTARDIIYAGEKTPDAPPPILPQDGVTLREEQRKSALPIYAFGLSWAACAIFLPFYRPLDFVVALILALIAFLRVSWSTPPRAVIVEVLPVITPPVQTGNHTLDQMLHAVQPQMETLRGLERTIGRKMQEPVRDILRTSEQIIEQVKQHPGKSGEVRQFFNYTLPTTLSLLQSYQELCAQPVQGENITAALSKIEGMTCKIVGAFHRQLDALFADKALNIAVELEVMDQMLRSDDDIKGANPRQ